MKKKFFFDHASLFGILSATFLVGTIWWIFEPYQSHYLIGLRFLGDGITQNLIGTPKEGRGDEWSTYLPLLKQAINEGFPAISSLPPYNEKLNWFISIPKLDYSLFFLPNHLAYWVLPAGKALSFQSLYYYLILLASFSWYLRNLRINNLVAISAAFYLAFSQFYQTWWTSNFPVLASIFLPLAVFTSNLESKHKFFLLFWSLGHLLFGQMYPPFYVSVAAALIPITLAIRTDLISLKPIIFATISAILAFSAYWIWAYEFISAVSSTSYPGQRFNLGGGSSAISMASLFFPLIGATPVANGGDVLYELSFIGTVLPLLALSALPGLQWSNSNKRVLFVFFATLAVLAWYALFGFNHFFAKYSGFFLVPGRRMHFGISVLVIVCSAFIVSQTYENARLRNILFVFLMSTLVYVLTPDQGWMDVFFGARFYGYIPISIIALIALLAFFFKDKFRNNLGRNLLVSIIITMAAVHVLVFGSFNPIMRASDITRPVSTQFVNDWKKLHEKNNRKPFAIDGNVGHLLRGEGLPALEAIHLVNAEKARYKEIFTDLSDDELDRYFNRFTGISFGNVGVVEKKGATLVFPIQEYGVGFEHEVMRMPSSKNSGSNLLLSSPAFTIDNHPDGESKIFWRSILSRAVAIEKKLSIHLPCKIDHSWLTRSPIAEVTDRENGASLRLLSGVFYTSDLTEVEIQKCLKDMRVNVNDVKAPAKT